jgi:hypothetical protein
VPRRFCRRGDTGFYAIAALHMNDRMRDETVFSGYSDEAGAFRRRSNK